jgi:CelD/BcsL family acetyltransferase involved in cellulose biosynthesis
MRDGASWSACLPVREYERWHRLPFACLGVWDHPYSLLRGPLVAPGEKRFASLLEALLAESRVVGLDLLPDSFDAGGEQAVELRSDERAVLRKRPENDYIVDRVSIKHRREFKRQARQLSERLDAPLELVDRAGEDEGVETFLRLEASGWKGRGGTAMASDPAHAEFFRAVARKFAERGLLELLFLEGGGTAAAGHCSFLGGDTSFSFKIGFDDELSRYSPGRELELRAMDRFHDDPRLQLIDSCAQPDNEYINRLWPDRRTLKTRAYFRPGVTGKAMRAGLTAAVAARRRRAEVS